MQPYMETVFLVEDPSFEKLTKLLTRILLKVRIAGVKSTTFEEWKGLVPGLIKLLKAAGACISITRTKQNLDN